MEWIDKQIKALQKVGKDARKSKKRAKVFIRSINPKNKNTCLPLKSTNK